MLIRKRLTGAVLGIAVLMAGGLVTTAGAMGPPGPEQTKPIGETEDTATRNVAEAKDLIRTLP